MRCQRYNYRYTVVMKSQQSFCDDWRVERVNIILAKTHWHPDADVYETNDEISLTMDLAGIDPEQLEISLYEDAVVVQGQRRPQPTSKKGICHMAEIRQGPFCFELPLSKSFKVDQVETQYQNGFLSIILHK
jgi:HSP20 family protein